MLFYVILIGGLYFLVPDWYSDVPHIVLLSLITAVGIGTEISREIKKLREEMFEHHMWERRQR